MTLKLTEKQERLYHDFQPRLTWAENVQPFRTPDGYIQIQLLVKNEPNYQSADTLQITNVTSEEVERLGSATSISSLRGGQQSELILTVALTETASRSGSFSLGIICSYKCSDSPQSVIQKSQDLSFTFVIRNDRFEEMANPFLAYEGGKPLEDASMFYGRSHQIEQIAQSLYLPASGSMNYGRGIAMYGQTRAGKTSVLLHLKSRLLEMYGDRVVLWDMGNIGEITLEDETHYLASFLYSMLYRGYDAICENNRLSPYTEDGALEPPCDALLSQPAFADTLFNQYMGRLNKILKKEQCIIVLILDEFTYLHAPIKEGRLSNGFMRFWKALLQNCCVFAVIAAQDDMPEFMREYPNEFACMELVKLTYLEERYAKQLIQEPLERSNHRKDLFRKDGAVDEIYDLTAGSAYLTVLLCSNLVKYLNDKGAYTITKGIVDDFLETRAFGPNSFLSQMNFESQLQERGHPENNAMNFQILLSVARASQTKGRADIRDIACEGCTPEALQTLVDRLVDRNVLVKEHGGYWIQVKLLEKWLIKTMGA